MNTMSFEFFLKQLKAGVMIDEFNFAIIDDPLYNDCYLGYLPQFEKPYWIGLCDVQDGCEFLTAEDLIHAKVYHGRSIYELWDKIMIHSIEGLSLEDWFKYCEHAQ